MQNAARTVGLGPSFDLGILWRYVGDLDRASASFGLAAAYFEAANDCYLSQR